MAGAVRGRLEDDDQETRDERGSEGLRERERPGESIIERSLPLPLFFLLLHRVLSLLPTPLHTLVLAIPFCLKQLASLFYSLNFQSLTSNIQSPLPTFLRL